MAELRFDPKATAEFMSQHKMEAGATLVGVSFLLHMTFIIKTISYVLLTCGAVLIWEAFRPKLNSKETKSC